VVRQSIDLTSDGIGTTSTSWTTSGGGRCRAMAADIRRAVDTLTRVALFFIFGPPLVQ
jgi:hypothetical protein